MCTKSELCKKEKFWAYNKVGKLVYRGKEALPFNSKSIFFQKKNSIELHDNEMANSV